MGNIEFMIEVLSDDKEIANEAVLQLSDELLGFNEISTKLPRTELEIPENVKGIDFMLIGALIVTMSPTFVTKFLEFLHEWSLRKEHHIVKIRVQETANHSIEIEVPRGATPEEVKKWIEVVKSSLGHPPEKKHK